MAIQKHKYELSIWNKELTDDGIKESKQQIIGADDMSHLGRTTNVHFKKLLNGTHVLTFQMPSMFFNSEKGDYVQNELIENLFNEQKIKLNFKDKWYELVIKDISESKNHKSIIKNFTCTDGYIDELSRTGYEIILDPELNNSVEEIHNFMENTLENSVWQYNPQWNWGDFTEYKEERCYKIPLSLFGGSITAYKFSLAIPEDCYSDTDKKEIINRNTNEKRELNYSDDLAGQQNMFWNQQDKNNSLFKEEITISGEYIYIPMSNLSLIQTPLYDNLDSAAQSTETYYNDSLTKYALQPNFKNPNDIIQFIYLPEDSSYTIDEANVLIDYNHTYILTVESFNNQNKSPLLVYYRNAEGEIATLIGDVYSNHNFMWKPIYNDGFLEYIGEKEINKVRRVNITNRTELNIYDDIYVNIYNNRITDKDIKPLVPLSNDQINEKADYRIMSKIDTIMVLPTLARNIVVNGKSAIDTSGWEAELKNTKVEITSVPYKIDGDKYIQQTKDSEEADTFLLTISNKNSGKESVINFGFVGNKINIEKNKIYALKIETIHEAVPGYNKAYTNYSNIVRKIAFAEGGINNEGNYKLLSGNKRISLRNVFNEGTVYQKYILFKSNVSLNHPYIEIELEKEQTIIIKSFEIFEAYTRGTDILESNIIEYRPNETKEYLQNNLLNRYSGRNFSLDGYIQDSKYLLVDSKDLLLESDVTLGEAYGRYNYYIQEKINLKTNASKDTFLDKVKWFEEDNPNFSDTEYVEDDFEYQNYELNLDLCNYADKTNSRAARECSYSTNTNHVCYYKKYGFCPYLFTPEKHPRRIRTLQQKDSNRFNIIQELSKVFEVYPAFDIDYDMNGKIKNIDKKPQKFIYFITEKGNEKLLGFRYEKNLTNISRTLNSNSITTKLFVNSVDSQLTDTGYCTIQAAADNLGKNSFILDFSYYTKKGLLNPETIEADLYGLGNENELAYLTKIDKVNSNYDYISSRINALTDENYKTLKATNETNLNGILAAQEEIGKISSNMSKYDKNNNKDNDTYKKYKEQLEAQKLKLYDLIDSLFYTNNYCYDINNNTITSEISVKIFEQNFIENAGITWEEFFEKIKKKQYKQCGTVGQETGIIDQVDELTKIRKTYLKQSAQLTKEFNKKYENYIKEGTWSDSNYLTDNEYYWGGVSVLSDSNKPQTNYTLSVIDITKTDAHNAEMYEVDIGDISYVEDEDFFGNNPITGLPNKEKIIISSIDYSLDMAQNDSIEVQNYTTQFNDLFQQITASVQSLTYNENIYKRAQSFTAQHYIKTDSLQGTLNTNELTLLNSNSSIKLDRNGTEGNAIQNGSSRYKLTGDGLFFSTNGGASWIQAVSPKGYNMDYAKFGAIDVNKIKLVDKEYVYFLWDQNGINAYNPSNTKDFARFNKYGLSLYKDNKIRMRAGYQYNENGEIDNETNIGFYLYDLKGNPIFLTQDGTNNSASLSLKGEICVQNAYADSGMAYTLTNSCIRTLDNTIYYYFQTHMNDSPIGKEYLIVYTNTHSAETYIGAEEDEETILELQQGYTYIISFLKRKFNYENYINEIPTSKVNGNIIYTSGPLKYFEGENLRQESHAQKIYYYEYTYKIVVNQNCTLGFKDRQGLSNYFCIPGLFNSNTDDNVTFDKSGLENYADIEVKKEWNWSSSSIADSTNRYYLSNTNENQNQYIDSFQLYQISDDNPTKTKENVLENDIYTKSTTYLDSNNNKKMTVDLYAIDNTRLYKNKENGHPVENKGDSVAIFINNQIEIDDENTLDNFTRLFCIAKQKKNSDQIKNIFSIFPNGQIYIGGTISSAGGETIDNIQNLPDKISIENPKYQWDALDE